MKLTHKFAEMTPEKRPRDPHMDGTALRFETLNHGREYPDTMPQAINSSMPEAAAASACRSCRTARWSTAKGSCSMRRTTERPAREGCTASTIAPAAPNERTHGPLSRSCVALHHVSRFDARKDFLQVANDPLHVGAERK